MKDIDNLWTHIFAGFTVLLAIGFVVIMSVSAAKYYINKNDRLEKTTQNDVVEGRQEYITNDMVIYLVTTADITRNGDTVEVTLYNPFNDFKWKKTEIIR